MECFNCLGSINEAHMADDKCFCSKPCVLSYFRPDIEEDITYNQETAKEMNHPTWKRMYQIQSLILIGCLKHSKKEQLDKLKASLQETMVDVLELVEKKHVENDVLKMSTFTKETFEMMGYLIKIFGS